MVYTEHTEREWCVLLSRQTEGHLKLENQCIHETAGIVGGGVGFEIEIISNC